ncbi:MAG: HAD-IIA family hydrolase [Ilumatobacteraceae bacterium]
MTTTPSTTLSTTTATSTTKPTTPVPVLCDLDGVVWLSQVPIEGSVDAIRRLRAAGHRVLFVTNNSFSEVGSQVNALESIGIAAQGDVLTSAMAAALLVEPGERVMVCGGPGIVEALAERGAIAADDGPFDAVMVGFHRSFDYEVMRRSSTAVRDGARLIATNDDATYPTPDGPIPGGGAILAGIVIASGVAPIVAGKPYPPMASLVRLITGIDDLSDAVMVGDRPDTDGLMAQTLGCRYAHVWSGVTPAGTDVTPPPSIQGPDLAAIADQLLRVAAAGV